MILTDRQKKTIEGIHKLQSGESVIINTQDAEECEDMGLVENEGSGRYILTAKGLAALKA